MKKIPGIDLTHIRGDVFGGITAGIVALPLALAFGVQSGLGAAAGLYGAIFISIFASVFGGTNTQISGPTAPMTAVSMVVVAGLLAQYEGDLEAALPVILAVFILAGLLQIGFGLSGIGKYIRYIPYPVVSGFMTGIGVLIIISQLLPLFGYYPVEDQQYVEEFKPEAEELILERILGEEAEEDYLVLEDFEETIRRSNEVSEEQIMKEARMLADQKSSSMMGVVGLFGRMMSHINWVEFLLALITIAFIYLLPKLTKAVPSPLVALVVVTAGAFYFIPGYRTIGAIPGGFPNLRLDVITHFTPAEMVPYLIMALSLALLGSIDSLLTSLVADNLTKTKHKSNQELIGQGIGNTISGFFGGIPGAGATMRTVINIQSGGKTKISGVIAGLLLLGAVLVFGSLAATIPPAVLAGILITVGIGVMDFRGLRHIRELPIHEVVVMLTVLFLTVFVGLIEAVAAGMVLASILFMKKSSNAVDRDTRAASIRDFADHLSWDNEGSEIEYLQDKVYIKDLNGPLFFGFSSQFQDLVNDLPDEIKAVVIQMDHVPYVDQSGIFAMEDAIDSLHDRDIIVIFTGLYGEAKRYFEKFKIVPGKVDAELSFDNMEACTTYLEGHVPKD